MTPTSKKFTASAATLFAIAFFVMTAPPLRQTITALRVALKQLMAAAIRPWRHARAASLRHRRLVLAQFFIQEFERFAGLSTKQPHSSGSPKARPGGGGMTASDTLRIRATRWLAMTASWGVGSLPAQHRQINYLPYDQRRILI